MQLCGQPWRSATSALTLSESSNTCMIRPLQWQHRTRRLVLNNSWGLTGMSTLTHPLKHISAKDRDKWQRRSWRHCQQWRRNNHQSPLCWQHWWLCRRGRTAKISWASRQSLHSQQHGDQCREDQVDDKQHQRHQQDQSKQTQDSDSHKLQEPGLSCIWWAFPALNTLQDSRQQQH